jgi:Lectin C-type domain.
MYASNTPILNLEPTTCEAGWIPWGTSCYGIIKGIPKTWDEARADCLRRFGDLVVIDSQEENNFVTYEIQPLRSVSLFVPMVILNSKLN